MATYQVLKVWFHRATDGSEGDRETVVEYQAETLSEALTMAERSDAGQPGAPDAYGILPADYPTARAEEIEFNEADGLLTWGL